MSRHRSLPVVSFDERVTQMLEEYGVEAIDADAFDAMIEGDTIYDWCVAHGLICEDED